VLTPAEREQFVVDGFIIVREVFDEEVARQLVDLVWERLGEDPLAPSESFRRRPQLEDVIESGPIDALLAPKLCAIVDELVGEGRWWTRRGFGWTIARLAAVPGTRWSPPLNGWHVDGMDFQHRLDSPEQALVGLEMLTPSRPYGGATALRRGSHAAVAQLLDRAGEEGVSYMQLRNFSDALEGHEVVQATGDTGDVLLMHPFLVHARGMNVLSEPRLAANRAFSLHKPMRIRHPHPDGFSLVEHAIRVALQLD